MTDSITIVGNVATDPVRSEIGAGVVVTNFRVASPQRRFDQSTRTWVEIGTNWYSVAAFRQLAEHAKASLRSGDSVIVSGRLKVRAWEHNGKQGTSIDIEAETIGHDLRWGTSAYSRSTKASTSAVPPSPAVSSSEQDVPAEPAMALAGDAWSAPLTEGAGLDQTPF